MDVKIESNVSEQILHLNDAIYKFKTPFSMCISGSSMSGKTEFIIKLLKHRKDLFDVDFDQFYYCTPESLSVRHNPAFEKIKEACPFAQFISGLPDIDKLHLNLDKRPKIVFIDDLQDKFLNSEAMLNLMTAGCHHFNISVVFTLQNFYAHSRFGRTIFRQIVYRVIFYNRLDTTEIRTVSAQISHQPKFLMDSFEFIKKELPNQPCYIIVDGHAQTTVKELFVKTRIFPDADGTIRPIYFFPSHP